MQISAACNDVANSACVTRSLLPALNNASEEYAHSHASTYPNRQLLHLAVHSKLEHIHSQHSTSIHLYIYTLHSHTQHKPPLISMAAMNGARTPVVEDPRAISKSRMGLHQL